MTDPLDRSRDTLQAARVLAARGFHASAVSRAYYVAFYAAREAILDTGMFVKTHRGVASEFSRLFVATRRIDAAASQALRSLHEQRTLADYQDGDVTARDAQAAVATASAFLDHVAVLFGGTATGEDTEAWRTFSDDQKRDLVAQLTREMDEASADREFERAAELRDSVAQIEADLTA